MLRPILQRMLFIRTDRLGDVLLNLPAVFALRAVYPTAHLAMLVQPGLVELFDRRCGVDQCLPDEAAVRIPWWLEAIRLAHRLRAGRFDVVIVSNPHKTFHLATFLAGIPVRVGYDRKWGWLLTHRIPDRKGSGQRHEVEYNLELLKPLGIAVPERPQCELPLDEEANAQCDRLIQGRGITLTEPLVAVHPWSSSANKQWAMERFRRLVQQLAQRPDVKVVVIGGQEERDRASEVIPGEERELIVNLVGCLSLRELAALLRRVQVLVTNDSGPMHIAAAVGTPVVALFGTGDPGSHPTRWGPWGLRHTVIHRPLSEIAVDEVLRAALRYVTAPNGVRR
ncbi:MAG: glycosyltransferase family 9 protein [Candidatus Omnitrophica bacterium]|nr:glycosyltransferase family 9 protein [Candidatus Omnitrophota bacterium]